MSRGIKTKPALFESGFVIFGLQPVFKALFRLLCQWDSARRWFFAEFAARVSFEGVVVRPGLHFAGF